MTGHVAQFFLDDAEWQRALSHIRSSLAPGGHLVFESRNPQVKPFAGWPTPSRHVKIPDTPLGPIEWWAEDIVFAGGKATYTLHYLFTADNEEIVSKNNLRFRTYEELEASLHDAGFDIERMYGGWDRSPFQSHSPEIVLICKAN
jgi:hypothetical protein